MDEQNAYNVMEFPRGSNETACRYGKGQGNLQRQEPHNAMSLQVRNNWRAVMPENAERVEEYERVLNDYARHELIKRVLAELVIDMTIARDIRHTDPMEFPLMLKREIDNIIDKWKQQERARGANGNIIDTYAKKSTGASTESLV